MLLSKINSLAHLCSRSGGELHLAKLQPGKDKEPLEKLYQVGPLLGFGSVYSGTRLSDGAPVAIKHVARDWISDWGELGICDNEGEPEPIHGDPDGQPKPLQGAEGKPGFFGDLVSQGHDDAVSQVIEGDPCDIGEHAHVEPLLD
ncbi:serine/threonine-protein kinase pim-1-like [Malaclemys terrapin pileata]|uniref:serine/threonine-protein kinase pim-1-like n=1 Tax=Malaclemys terrapin pileata TaxID=2991368 RepID=UPI0023A79F01|nr:serine/threonine-protein kinase pim-1-like [Malaclemys terrapin pileata]